MARLAPKRALELLKTGEKSRRESVNCAHPIGWESHAASQSITWTKADVAFRKRVVI